MICQFLEASLLVETQVISLFRGVLAYKLSSSLGLASFSPCKALVNPLVYKVPCEFSSTFSPRGLAGVWCILSFVTHQSTRYPTKYPASYLFLLVLLSLFLSASLDYQKWHVKSYRTRHRMISIVGSILQSYNVFHTVLLHYTAVLEHSIGF